MRTYNTLKDIPYSEMTEEEAQTMVDLRVNQAKQEAQTGYITDLNTSYINNLKAMVNVISNRFDDLKDSMPAYIDRVVS